MVKVWYCNRASLTEEEFKDLLKILPAEMWADILRYKAFEHKAARLIARLLVRKAIIDTGNDPGLFLSYEKENYGKPFIRNWVPFNISYSKDLIAIAFEGGSEIGLDIETIEATIDTASLHRYFCPQEQEMILNDHGKQNFFNIWTRKEALSKALGIGIANGLDLFDCTKTVVNYQNKTWFLHKIHIMEDYICHLAIDNNESQIVAREIAINELA